MSLKSDLATFLTVRNRDLRWYRDKYLGAICGLALVVGMSHLRLPGTLEVNVVALSWLGIAVVAFIFFPRKLFLVAFLVGLFALRGIIGGAIGGSLPVVLLGFAAAVACTLLMRLPGSRFNPPYTLHEYTYGEGAIDGVVGLVLLRIAIPFT